MQYENNSRKRDKVPKALLAVAALVAVVGTAVVATKSPRKPTSNRTQSQQSEEPSMGTNHSYAGQKKGEPTIYEQPVSRCSSDTPTNTHTASNVYADQRSDPEPPRSNIFASDTQSDNRSSYVSPRERYGGRGWDNIEPGMAKERERVGGEGWTPNTLDHYLNMNGGFQ